MTGPTRAEQAAVLDKADTILGANGWLQGDLYDRQQQSGGTPPAACRMCLIGATNTAAGGEPRLGDMGALDLADAALRVVADQLGLSPGRELAVWNDQRGRTVDEVRQALRDTAAGLRAGVTV